VHHVLGVAALGVLLKLAGKRQQGSPGTERLNDPMHDRQDTIFVVQKDLGWGAVKGSGLTKVWLLGFINAINEGSDRQR
jgi:hypothetical protein